MNCGWVGKILDVDLTTGIVRARDTAPYARDWLGGRALAARIAWEELPPNAGPYDPENLVVVATGPLTGTLAPTTGRTVIASVSPRVYPKPWYTHSTLGGWFGPALKYAGFDALIIRGQAASPVYLDVRDDDARLVDATDLWGRDARETQLALKDRLGAEVQVLAIGQAGENLCRFATIQHAEENAAGVSGFGAVWGSKRLKAIVARGTGGVGVADPLALLAEVRAAGKFKLTPNHAALYPGDEMRQRRPVCSQSCTFNCHLGNYGRRRDGRVVPGWCVGGLDWLGGVGITSIKYSGGGVEMPAARNFDRADEAELLDLANSLGLDVSFRHTMMPWFVRCRQLGVDTIRGHPVEPDSPAWLTSFARELAEREGLGAIFADDLRRAVDELEGELPEELIHLGRAIEYHWGFPPHREGRFVDEEPLPFWVISAMMHASETRDPAIGAHQSSLLLADFLLVDRELALRQFRVLSDKVWGRPDAFEPTFENKAPVAIWSQHQHMLIDSLPVCDFAFPQLIRPLAGPEEWRATADISGDLDVERRLLVAVTGVPFTPADLALIAERAFTLERLLLVRAGRTRSLEEALAPHFALPCRSDGTSVDAAGFSRLLDEYYDARGWDREFGWPKADLLERLGLTEATSEVAERRLAHQQV
jgi:hypothetical protein